jgi:hypothetical protein
MGNESIRPVVNQYDLSYTSVDLKTMLSFVPEEYFSNNYKIKPMILNKSINELEDYTFDVSRS